MSPSPAPPAETRSGSSSCSCPKNATASAPWQEKDLSLPDAPEPLSEAPAPAASAGLPMQRHFTRVGIHPFDEVAWERRTAVIANEKGEEFFRQEDVEIPASWSMMATNVVVSKYFRGALGTPARENSVRQLIGRVAETLALWGKQGQYFATPADAETFEAELSYLLVNQYAAFNSPVWFNVGVEKHPQCSACFINSVEDTMWSIMTLARTEGMLFKYGSGTGSNLSTIRSSREKLQGGGTASGPVSFMRGFDAFAGVIKSGGKTRRAAKMVILNADHPDILEFVDSKAHEEKKAWALIDAGYDGSFNGEAYSSIFFQNSNNSVRVTDEFMQAYEKGGKYWTKYVITGKPCEELDARAVMRRIAEAAWVCGDPGLQFHTTINRWHTCKATAQINASNPCSEFMFLDDSACNLASLNMLKFLREDGTFDVEGFRHAVRIVFLAQEIMVSNASYPSDKIGANSEKFRPLGLGYANLGALLMALGVPYDSEEGRQVAATVTALMTGEAYRLSAAVAATKGPFDGYAPNRDSMLETIEMHRAAARRIPRAACLGEDVLRQACEAWDDAVRLGQHYGFRNAQASVIAPTGTIGFMMDCDTTGIEPDLALVKYKKLVGGGLLKIVNQTVPRALQRLGYSPDRIQAILDHSDKEETIEGAPHLAPEHLPVFDCAFRPANGKRFIHYMGHVRMMAAVQPFVSGAISKTVNMPNETTPEEIEKVYAEAWRMGLKALAIYRDGCKRTQPMSASRAKESGAKEASPVAQTQQPSAPPAAVVQTSGAQPAASPKPQIVYKPLRERLPAERRAITHKFEIGNHEGYLTVGLYDDGRPGELFIRMAKEGSTISGLMDAFATAISISLQYGVPLNVLVNKFVHTRFEPSGFTKNREIPVAKSIMDYIFRWLAAKFLSKDEAAAYGVVIRQNNAEGSGPVAVPEEPRTPPPSKAHPAHPESDPPSNPASTAAAGSPGISAAESTGGNGKAKGKNGNGQSKTETSSQEAVMAVASEGQDAVSNASSMAAAGTRRARAALVSGDPAGALAIEMSAFANQQDAPLCSVCGAITVRSGACYKCLNCGTSLGCG